MTADGFLAGGGEMGALMRSHDWSHSALGPVERWPQSLRTSVSTCLNCAFPILVWWGPDLVMLYNDEYRSILGSTKHPAALGEKGAVVWPEIWHVIGPMLRQVMEHGEATRSRDLLLVMDRHGYAEETYFSFSYSPIRDETGGGVFCPVIETTEKVIGERRLRTLTELSAAVQEARDADEACKRAVRILATNAADVPFSLVYLLDADGASARLVASANIPAGHEAAAAAIAVADTQSRSWPVRAVVQDNEPVLIRDFSSRLGTLFGENDMPIRDAIALPMIAPGESRPAGILIAGVNPRRPLDAQHHAFFDLAADHVGMAVANARAYQAERRRAEALAELDRAKTAFFSNVSHEFRTPLTLILGTLEEALAAGDLPERHREELAVAHRNSLRLLRLVNTLLDFSRVEAGRIEAGYELVDLAALTAELASNFRSACERAGLRFEVDCETLPGAVYVDRDMWEKIVLNLISNAFKFTLEGGIAIRLSASAGYAHLAVIDTGIGIPREHFSRIFERFHRVPDTRGRTHEGTGIGLSLVQELVKLHGGSVTVESEQGRGSTFTVSIPLGSAHLPQDRIGAARRLSSTSIRAEAFVDEALRWLPGEEHAGRPGTGSDLYAHPVPAIEKRRLLVVDDNADMRDYLVRLLQPFHDVVTAPDGSAALDLLSGHRPDLVLSDVMMPGVDGAELVRAIRSDPALRQIPVILLSARAGEEARIEGLNAGADDYIVKPFSARELLARIESNLKLASVRKKAIAELRASEERLRAFVSASSDAIYRMSADWTELRQLVGRDFIADTRGPSRSWLESYIHPDDRPRVMKTVEEAIRTKSVFELEHRVRRVDGGLGWTYSRAVPVLDEKGDIVEWFGAATDVTERKAAEERQKLLVDELNHRVKNTLASVQSVAMQTLRSASSLADFEQAFVSRLMALSRTHDLLTRSRWQSASLLELVRQTLEPYGAGAGRMRFGGPEMRLNPSAALTLSMGLHELATNAAKYGALSGQRGRVDVRWLLDGTPRDPAVVITWIESDGPHVARPERRGFGSRLIERGIAQDLDGEVRLDFKPEGVQCLIRLPVSERVSIS